jgi:hypothetical protein
MSIQSNVNQMISIAGVLLNTNPTLQARAKAREEAKAKELERKKTLENLTQKKAILKEGIDVAAGEAKPEVGEALLKKYGATALEQFELDPTKENLADYTSTLPGPSVTFKEEPEKIAQELYEEEEYQREVQDYLNMYRGMSEKATGVLSAKQEEKRKTRRNFLDYIKEEPTSLGGTVGELDPKLQKAIAKNYSKSERKKIMDRKDETE